jgi:hypothetical protein
VASFYHFGRYQPGNRKSLSLPCRLAEAYKATRRRKEVALRSWPRRHARRRMPLRQAVPGDNRDGECRPRSSCRATSSRAHVAVPRMARPCSCSCQATWKTMHVALLHEARRHSRRWMSSGSVAPGDTSVRACRPWSRCTPILPATQGDIADGACRYAYCSKAIGLTLNVASHSPPKRHATIVAPSTGAGARTRRGTRGAPVAHLPRPTRGAGDDSAGARRRDDGCRQGGTRREELASRAIRFA